MYGKDLSNWEKYIFELMEVTNLSSASSYQAVVNEIKQCYCFGFIDDIRRKELLYYLQEIKEKKAYEDKIAHEQRMYEIALGHEKIHQQKEVKSLLIKADNDYNKKYVDNNLKRPKGRPRKS